MTQNLTRCDRDIPCNCSCHHGDCAAIHVTACCHTCRKCGKQNVVYCEKELEGSTENDDILR